MKELSPQKQYIYNLFKDGAWHCSNFIDPHIVRDYRKRISEMNHEGFTFESQVCNGACGFKHKAGVHMYRIETIPTRTVEIRDNDTLSPIKIDGRWVPQPVYKKETVPMV